MKRLFALSLLLLELTRCSSLRPDHHEPVVSVSPGVPSTPPSLSVEQEKVPPIPAEYSPDAALSLDQLIDVALRNSPSTRVAWLEARSAAASLRATEASYLPAVDLTAQVQELKQAVGSSSSFSPNAHLTYAASLGLSYLLFDFGGRAAQVEESRQALIAAGYEHNAAIRDVVFNVARAYYQLLDARARLAAQKTTLEELRVSLDAADARHQAGIATIADVLQARTALSQGELNDESLSGNAATLAGTLANALGLPATMTLPVGSLPEDISASEVGQVESLVEQAYAERPELGAARARLLRARSRIREVRSQGLPTVSLNASGGGVHNQPGSGFPDVWSTGLFFRFPLFTGFRNTFETRAAELEADRAAAQVTELERQVDLQVWSSYQDIRTAAQRLETSRSLLASAQQSRDVAQGRYKEGVGSILDVLTAQAALANARAQQVQARADWLLALARLAHDTGPGQQESAMHPKGNS